MINATVISPQIIRYTNVLLPILFPTGCQIQLHLCMYVIHKKNLILWTGSGWSHIFQWIKNLIISLLLSLIILRAVKSVRFGNMRGDHCQNSTLYKIIYLDHLITGLQVRQQIIRIYKQPSDMFK